MEPWQKWSGNLLGTRPALLDEATIDAAVESGVIADYDRSFYRGIRRNWVLEKMTARQHAHLDEIHRKIGKTPALASAQTSGRQQARETKPRKSRKAAPQSPTLFD